MWRIARLIRSPGIKTEALRNAIKRKDAAIQTLKERIELLKSRNDSLASDNARLKEKVGELYRRNVSYAKRINNR